MGDTGEYFKAFNEMQREAREIKEPTRIKYALDELKGLKCDCQTDGEKIVVEIGCGRIDFWAYTGWFCGRKPLLGRIKGRGINNLIKAIKAIT